jgi:MFS family permease
VLVNLVPLLVERGFDTTTAAWALGLGGAGQVAGRLGYAALARRTSVGVRTALVVAAVAATTAMLGLFTTVAALVAASVAAGAARGVFTLLRATAVTDRWGVTHYGRLTGLLSAPPTTATALAPFAGAALAGLLGDHSSAFLLLAATTLVAALLTLASTPARKQPT